MSYLVEFLNNPAKTYYTGNLICCQLNISLKQEKLLKDLRIVFEGKSKIRWEEDTDTEIKGKQRFFAETILIGRALALTAGEHSFQFELQLPNDLPPTFHGKYGFIEFKVIVMTKDSKINGVYPFTVVSFPLQPNLEDCIPLIINVGESSGIHFPKESVIRGSIITVEVISMEPRKSKNKTITINLMQYLTYATAYFHEKTIKTNVVKVPITTIEDYKGTFQIPNNLMKTLNFDSLEIIKVRYVLKIYVNSKKFKFPIVIH